MQKWAPLKGIIIKGSRIVKKMTIIKATIKFFNNLFTMENIIQ